MSRFYVNGIAEYAIVLVLNGIMHNADQPGTEFGPFDTIELARQFYNSHLVEPYIDSGPNMNYSGGSNGTCAGLQRTYHKTFRKGSPLEHYNPLSEEQWNCPDINGFGIHEVLTRITDVQRQYEIK